MTIRPPAVAGMFYPAEPHILRSELDKLLERVSMRKIRGSVAALIVPHAGYQYSGFTAAIGWSAVKRQQFDTIVVVSPSHHEYFDGISVYDGSAFATPLGHIEIDSHLRAELVQNDPVIRVAAIGHGREHAVEVHIPFIQRLFHSAKILPIVMGDQRGEYCLHLGSRLATILRSTNTLLVASTDLSHYFTYAMARTLDGVFAEDVGRFNPDQLLADLESERTQACGGGPTVAVLMAAKKLGANHVELLYQCNSGDVTGDHRAVVGYLSAAVIRTN
jgi:AmmeMemoRadiSam system protein B